MPLPSGARTPSARWLVPLAALLVAALAAAPALGFSRGICAGCPGGASAPPGEFDTLGCTACHGEHAKFPSVSNAGIDVTITAADGTHLNGPYAAHGVYTITINFTETNAPDAANKAGFNLRASGGTLSAVDGQSQVSANGAQATHVDPTRTSWSVGWEAPESGAVGFSLFVNDVDGDASNSPGDEVHWIQFGVADPEGAVVGAAAEEHEVHFGISLQQYWIGLIGLAGMLFVMVAGFVYLKFVNPHNTDQKDR